MHKILFEQFAGNFNGQVNRQLISVFRTALVLGLLTFAPFVSAQSIRDRDFDEKIITNERPSAIVNVAAPTRNAHVGDTITIPLSVSDTTGLGIFGYRFQISFDQTVLQPSGPNFGCSEAGTQSSGATATCNLFPDAHTITVFYFRAAPPLSGTLPLINLKFLVVGSVGNVSPLNFVDFFFNEGGPADPIDVTLNGSVTVVSIVTAANTSVSGRVLTANGSGLNNAVIALIDLQGFFRSAVSSSFGYYRIEDVPVGSSYVISLASKRYTLTPRVIQVTDELTEVDLVCEP